MTRIVLWTAVGCLAGTGALTARQIPAGSEYHPAWSPDSRLLAYASNADGDFEIFVVSVDGGRPRQLTHNDVLDTTPAFTPDGRAVLFSSAFGPDRDIYRVPVTGGAPEPFIVRPGSGENRPQYIGATEVSFNTGLGTANRDIFIYDLATDLVRAFVAGPANDEWGWWSTAGDLVLFSTDRDGQWEVYRSNRRGGEQRRLTWSPEDSENDAASLSPDGRRFVYQSNKSGDMELYLHVIATGGERNLTMAPGSEEGIPAWSPDGRFIAFECTRDGIRKIYVMMPDGSAVRRVTPGAGANAVGTASSPMGRDSRRHIRVQ